MGNRRSRQQRESRSASASQDAYSDVIDRLRNALRGAEESSWLGPAAALGVECEFELREHGRHVDFSSVFPLFVEQAAGDLMADQKGRYHFHDGTLLMADGAYAELATPLEPLGRNTAQNLTTSLIAGRNRLVRLCRDVSAATGRDYALFPYSAHYNIQADRALDHDAFAQRFLRDFGLVAMTLTSLPDTLGLICRPRPRRLEIVADYIVDPVQFRASVALLIGAFFAARERHRNASIDDLPTLSGTAIVPVTTRYGWRVNFEPMDARQRRRLRDRTVPISGGPMSIQMVLDRTFAAIRPHLTPLLAAEEIELLADYVGGQRPVAFERDDAEAAAIDEVAIADPGSTGRQTLAAGLRSRAVGAWSLRPCFVQWEFVVHEAVAGASAPLYLCVPLRAMAGLGAGTYDETLAKALDEFAQRRASGGGERPLASLEQARDIGLFSSIDIGGLAHQLEYAAAFGKKKRPPKKPPRTPEHLCSVTIKDGGKIEICWEITRDPQRLILFPWEAPQNATTVAYGVWVHSGAFGERHVDLHVPGRGLDFVFTRYYRSSIDYNGIMGRGWDHGYNIRIVPDAPAAKVDGDLRCEIYDGGAPAGGITYYAGTGRHSKHDAASWADRIVRWCDDRGGQVVFRAIVTRYRRNPGEVFEIERYAVVEVVRGTMPECLHGDPIFYRLRAREGLRMLFNCHGYVVEIRDRNRNHLCFTYGFVENPTTNYLVLEWITDTLGRKYHLEYEIGDDRIPRVSKLTDFASRLISYHYDDTYQLDVVKLVKRYATDPETTQFRPEIGYKYDSARLGLLKEITRPHETANGGGSWLENHYDPEGRVYMQRVGSPVVPPAQTPCGGTFIIDYATAGEVTVTDRAMAKRKYTMNGIMVRSVAINDEIWDGSQAVTKDVVTTYDHDANFHIEQIIHPSGRKEHFGFSNAEPAVTAGDERDDVTNNITHYDDLSRDDLLEHRLEPSGGGTAFTARYEYEHLFNALTKETTPTGETIFTYDHGHCAFPERNGNPTKITKPKQMEPDGNSLEAVEMFRYGLGGVRIYYRDADRVENHFTPTPEGRIRSHKIGNRVVESWDYDQRGNLKWRKDDRGAMWRYEKYDDRDRLVEAIDPHNHRETYAYDLNDRLTERQVPLVDDPSAVTGLLAATPRTVQWEHAYDILGHRRKTSQTATPLLPTGGVAGSRTWEWNFDAEERLVIERRPRATANQRADAVVRHEYNARGLCAAATTGYDPAKPTWFRNRVVYTPDGSPGRVEDALGKAHTCDYDGYGRQIKQTDPDGTERHRIYSGPMLAGEWVKGKITQRPTATPVSCILQETYYLFDVDERPLIERAKVFDPLLKPDLQTAGVPTYNAEMKTWYTAAGRLKKRADSAGRITEYEYDRSGRVSDVRLPGGHSSTCFYSGSLPQITMTTFRPDQGTSCQPAASDILLTEVKLHDSMGRVIYAEDEHGVFRQLAYDSMGNLRAEQGTSYMKSYTYDGFGRLLSETTEFTSSPSNSSGQIKLRYEYDLDDNRVISHDALNRPTVTIHDGGGRLLTLAQPGHDLLELKYRADGRVERTTRGSNTAEYVYSDAGHATAVTYRSPVGTLQQSFGYDGLGRLHWCGDSNNLPSGEFVWIYRTYDSIGRLITEATSIPHIAYSERISHEYDASHLKRTVNYPRGLSATYTYGLDGNVKEITEGGTALVRRLHQGPGRLLEAWRSVKVGLTDPGTSSFALSSVECLEYDGHGRMTRRLVWLEDAVNQPGQNSFVPLGPQDGFVYNTAGQVEAHTQERPEDSFEYGYDGAGRVRYSLQGPPADCALLEYDWDAANRLHGIEKTRVVGGVRQATTDDLKVTYRDVLYNRTDNVEGRRSLVSVFETSGGRLATSNEYRTYAPLIATNQLQRIFHYDAADRLQRAELKIPATLGFTNREPNYLYDAFGRLVARFGGQAGMALPSREREVYLYDGRHCVLDFDTSGTALRQYIYDDDGGLVLFRFQDQLAGATRETLPILTATREPWLLLHRRIERPSTPPAPGAAAPEQDRSAYYRNTLGVIFEEHLRPPFAEPKIIVYDYRPPLSVTASQAQSSMLPLQSGGRYFPEERLVALTRRFYDPQLRCFIMPDRAGAWGTAGSAGNPYAFAGNNPVAFGENGREILTIIAAIAAISTIGAVVGAGICVAGQFCMYLDNKHRPYLDRGAVVDAAIAGAVLAPAAVFAPEIVVPLMAAQGAGTVYHWWKDDIGNWTAGFELLLLALPFKSAQGRAGIMASLGEGSVVGSLRGLGEVAGLAERAKRFTAFHEAPVRSQETILRSTFDAGLVEGLETLIHRWGWSIKKARGSSGVAATHGHHAFPTYLIEAIQRSRARFRLRRGFRRRQQPRQELIQLNWSLHLQDLHVVMDIIGAPRRVSARRIARLIDEGHVTPERIANFLESFYPVALRGYPAEIEAAVAQVRSVRQQLGI